MTCIPFLYLILNVVNMIPERGVSSDWGFFPHKMINRLAVFTLPPEMLVFYKYHLYTITNLAVQADRRRYANEAEAPRHYIDLDFYGKEVPRDWSVALKAYGDDSLHHHGILPWYLPVLKYRLTDAFKCQRSEEILKLSSDVAHYLADAHVPLHTTSNYNGQLTGQHGIHGFWETRVPELLWTNFDLWVGRAQYWPDFSNGIWQIVWESHQAVDSVLAMEWELTKNLGVSAKYSYETRNNRIVRTYSEEFTLEYHRALNGQVLTKLKQAIRRVGDFWYTCWVDAGQPPLAALIPHEIIKIEQWQDSLWRNQDNSCHYGR